MRDYCDAQAGFWLHSKFWSKFSRKPLSGISDQKVPPPLISENFRFGMTKVYSGIPPPPHHFGKLQIWDDQSLLRNTPHPPYPPRSFKNAENYYMWRLYPTGITTRCNGQASGAHSANFLSYPECNATCISCTLWNFKHEAI